MKNKLECIIEETSVVTKMDWINCGLTIFSGVLIGLIILFIGKYMLTNLTTWTLDIGEKYINEEVE